MTLVSWELSNPQLRDGSWSEVTVSGGTWTGILVSYWPSFFAQTLLEFNFRAPGKQPAPVVSGNKVGESIEKPGRRLEKTTPGVAGRMDPGSGVWRGHGLGFLWVGKG